MSDDALRALERAVRAGDASARPALVRALLRAGRPIHDAWGAVALRAGPGLRGGDRGLTAASRDRLAEDLAWLAPDVLVDHLTRSKTARRLLEVYPTDDGARWLTITGRGKPADPWRVDLSSPPPSIRPGQDARLPRDRWDGRCVATRATLPLRVPVSRLPGLGVALFARLGAPIVARVFHRQRDAEHREHETETLHVDGDRGIRIREVLGPLPIMESRDRETDAAIEGLPGDPPVTLAFASTATATVHEAWWVGRADDLARADAAWSEVLFSAARAQARFDDTDPLDRLLPDAWLARARRAVVLPADGHVVVGPFGPAPLWSIAAIEGVPLALALTGGLAVDPAATHDGPFVRPVGPAPARAVARGLRVCRPGRDDDHPLGPLFHAVSGEALPVRAELERRTDPTAGDRPRGRVIEATRHRVGPWVALRTRDDLDGSRFRILHESGAVALLGSTRREGPSEALEVSILAAPDDAEARREAVLAALEREGFAR